MGDRIKPSVQESIGSVKESSISAEKNPSAGKSSINSQGMKSSRVGSVLFVVLTRLA
jgi:hypothetical protein